MSLPCISGKAATTVSMAPFPTSFLSCASVSMPVVMMSSLELPTNIGAESLRTDPPSDALCGFGCLADHVGNDCLANCRLGSPQRRLPLGDFRTNRRALEAPHLACEPADR